jgi:hypothetical protein
MLSCMRTTIEITDELCRQLKRKAADEGVTIRQVVESALWVTSVNKRDAKVTRLNGKQNVRLDDRDALFDLIDGRR